MGPVRNAEAWALRWQRRRKLWWYPWSLEKLLRRWACRVVLAGALLVLGPAVAPATSRVLEATAQAAEAVSAVVGTVAWTGANITATAGSWFTSSASLASGMAHATWAGIDILDVSATMQRAHIFTNDPESLERFLRTEGSDVVAASSQHVENLLRLLRASGLSRPVVFGSWDNATLAHRFETLHVKVQLRASGLTVASWAAANISYKLQWANPLWDIWGSPPEAELMSIAERLRELTARLQLQDVDLLNLSVPEEEAERTPLVVFHKPANLWLQARAAWRKFYAMAVEFLDPWQFRITLWCWGWAPPDSLWCVAAPGPSP